MKNNKIINILDNEISQYLFNKNYNELSYNEIGRFVQYKYDINHPKWKKIVFDGTNFKYDYEISNTGKVRYFSKSENGYIYISSYIEKTDYCRINLSSITNKQIKQFIHRLVALAFIPNDDSEHKIQVNHINGNKQCNWVGNLEWVTASENNQHAIRTGLYNPYSNNQAYGEKAGACTHTEEQVRKACELLEKGELTCSKIGKLLGVSTGFVYSLREGRWRHITKEYDIPQRDDTKNRSVREKIQRLIKNGKITLEEVKKSTYPELGSEWDEYINNQLKKLLNAKSSTTIDQL